MFIPTCHPHARSRSQFSHHSLSGPWWTGSVICYHTKVYIHSKVGPLLFLDKEEDQVYHPKFGQFRRFPRMIIAELFGSFCSCCLLLWNPTCSGWKEFSHTSDTWAGCTENKWSSWELGNWIMRRFLSHTCAGWCWLVAGTAAAAVAGRQTHDLSYLAI